MFGKPPVEFVRSSAPPEIIMSVSVDSLITGKRVPLFWVDVTEDLRAARADTTYSFGVCVVKIFWSFLLRRASDSWLIKL